MSDGPAPLLPRSSAAIATISDSELGRGGRAREWLARYGAAEAAGIITAVLGAWIVRSLTHDPIATAYGGALGENAGFYGTIVAREAAFESRLARAAGHRFGARGVLRVALSLVTEFGPAELLDSGVIRPLAMGIAARFLGPVGIVAGKLAADVTFYVPVIISYELRKRLRREAA
jgi:hypothetical protein